MLTNRQFSSVKFINLFDGHFAIQAQANAEGANKRINKNGIEVWEYLYNNLSGVITDIISYENEYGKQWRVSITDGPEKYVLSLPDTSRYTRGFMFRIGRVNLQEPVDLLIGKFIADGKEIGYLTIHQGGQKIEPMWTKDNPGELPQMQKILVRGKEAWDDSDQILFIEGFVKNTIIPKLHADIELEGIDSEWHESAVTSDNETDMPF
jgi:hypothetical protein